MTAVMFAFGFAILAATQAPVARSTTDFDQVGIGDRVAFIVTIEGIADSLVTWPVPDQMGPFEVMGLAHYDSVTTDGRSLAMGQYTLAAFEIGQLDIPGFEVLLNAPSAPTIAVPGIRVEVASVGPDIEGDILDIKPPLSLERNWWWVVLWGVVAVALIALGWWGARRYRNKESPSTDPSVPERTPGEIALQALDALEQSDELQRGDVKGFAIRLSEILRVYLEMRYQILAMEMTTEDLLPVLRQLNVSREAFDSIERVLRQCDLVKFAKVRPDPDRLRAMIPVARHIVAQSASPTEEAA